MGAFQSQSQCDDKSLLAGSSSELIVSVYDFAKPKPKPTVVTFKTEQKINPKSYRWAAALISLLYRLFPVVTVDKFDIGFFYIYINFFNFIQPEKAKP